VTNSTPAPEEQPEWRSPWISAALGAGGRSTSAALRWPAGSPACRCSLEIPATYASSMPAPGRPLRARAGGDRLYLEGRALERASPVPSAGGWRRRQDLASSPISMPCGSARDASAEEQLDCTVRNPARSKRRQPPALDDIELEIYRSGEDCHLMLSCRPSRRAKPMLCKATPVCMDGESACAASAPTADAPLEAPGPGGCGPCWDLRFSPS